MPAEQGTELSSTRSVGATGQYNLNRRQNRESNVTLQYNSFAFTYEQMIDYAADKSVDFRQTLLVIPRSTATDDINACLMSSNLWRYNCIAL